MPAPLDPDRWSRIETLFADALDRPEAAREAFVRAHAGPDAALADEVLGLIAHHDDAEAAWGESAADWGAPLLADADRRAGDRIGAYVLDHPLGRGGMGTVWRAHRDDGATDGAGGDPGAPWPSRSSGAASTPPTCGAASGRSSACSRPSTTPASRACSTAA